MSLADRLTPAPQTEPAGSVEYGPDGGEFRDIRSEERFTDWDHVFERFNLDPDAYEIEGDTVRISHWQQSRRTNDGDRDLVNLYSYRAKFKRKANHLDAITLDDMVARMRGTTLAVPERMDQPVTAFVGMADVQAGKSYGPGRGTPETLARLEKSLAGVVEWIRSRRELGYEIERIILANMGDLTEGVSGSYASQPYSVDLNLRDQLTLGVNLTLEWIRTLAPLVQHFEYAACLCNHGALSRNGGKSNITDESDNAAGLIADTVRKVCDHIPRLSGIEWSIPRAEMITTTRASGVNVALAHGHKITGSERTWLASQSNRLAAQGDRPELWITAHRHSLKVDDFGPHKRIQCTTSDPGSDHYTDTTGDYSTPGVTVTLIGEHLPMKFAELAVL